VSAARTAADLRQWLAIRDQFRCNLCCDPGCRGFKSHHSPHQDSWVTCGFVRSPTFRLTAWLGFWLGPECDAGHISSVGA
jgi:hypothetical protein